MGKEMGGLGINSCGDDMGTRSDITCYGILTP
jgi:hypothetical protein